MKLYSNISRFRVRRHTPKWAEKRIRWALSLKPGDLINDCSGFNVVIRSIEPRIAYYHNGWVICGVDFTSEPYGGSCSLLSCGVEAAKPRDILEKDHLQFCAGYLTGDGPGTAAYWFGGRDHEDFKQFERNYAAQAEIVQNGGHFLDERGILLDEFRRRE